MAIKRNFLKLVYYAGIVAVVVTAIAIYLAWWRHSRSLNMRLTQAIACVHTEEAPVSGTLLWREELIKTSIAGRVSYPFGSNAVVASKGTTVAIIKGIGRKRIKLRTSQRGYFIPAVDGREEKWVYSRLWPGLRQLPEAPVLKFFYDGQVIRKGGVVGKLITQPQELRCIVYSFLTPDLKRKIERNFVDIKLNETGGMIRADVRVCEYYGHKVKLYLTLPFFPLSLINSRSLPFHICGGTHSGVMVPESAVVNRDGVQGVFKVEGNRTIFCRISGTPLSEGRFFISDGLEPGNLVILNGNIAREGKIGLW